MALFQKGNQFGKRSKGKRANSAQKLAERVRRITKGGKLIQDAALAVMMDPKAKPIERLKAAEFLKETAYGLASRGGEAEDGKGNILINVVYYTKPPAPDAKTQADDSAAHATQPDEKAAGAGEKEQPGGGGMTHPVENGASPSGATVPSKI